MNESVFFLAKMSWEQGEREKGKLGRLGPTTHPPPLPHPRKLAVVQRARAEAKPPTLVGEAGPHRRQTGRQARAR